jgi:hypothetical protein
MYKRETNERHVEIKTSKRNKETKKKKAGEYEVQSSDSNSF